MTDFALTGRLADVFGTMQIFDTPMFLVLIEEDESFRFGGLNRAHEQATGLTNAQLAGKTPHELLPPRVADTVCANYRKCVSCEGTPGDKGPRHDGGFRSVCAVCAKPYTYEEVLELPGGRRWWRTTLVPVHDGERVAAIVGTAFDITDHKEQLGKAAAEASRQRRRATDYQTASHASVSLMRGPLNVILTLCSLLRSEIAAESVALQHLEMVMDTAVNALGDIDLYEQGGRNARTPAMRDIDFGHLCRDVAALADPDRRLNISFPEITIHAEPDMLGTLANAAVERLLPFVDSRIDFTITPEPRHAFALHLRIDCDLRTGVPESDLAAEGRWLQALAATQGADPHVDIVTRPDGRKSFTAAIVLPGKIVTARSANRPDPPVSADQTRLATG